MKLKRLLKKYKTKLKITFLGYFPMAFQKVLRSKTGGATFVVSDNWKSQVTFVPGASVAEYPHLISCIKANIAIAPLIDCVFNEAKSEVKVLEYWARGLPVVATKIAPYKRAITQNETGLLAEDRLQWEVFLSRLIESPCERNRLGAAGRAEVEAKYEIGRMLSEHERAILSVAKGHTGRPAAEAAIEEGLKCLNESHGE